MADGKGCVCAAYSSSECACDADWTPQIVYDQKEKIAELESRLAEAVRVLAVAMPWIDRCPVDGLERQQQSLILDARNVIKNNPTTSKALEIVRVNREAIKTVVNFIRGGQWREVYIGERYDQFKTSIKSEFKRQLFEALDALTSEEGKV